MVYGIRTIKLGPTIYKSTLYHEGSFSMCATKNTPICIFDNVDNIERPALAKHDLPFLCGLPAEKMDISEYPRWCEKRKVMLSRPCFMDPHLPSCAAGEARTEERKDAREPAVGQDVGDRQLNKVYYMFDIL